MAAILDGHFLYQKNVAFSCEDSSNTILVRIHSRVRKNYQFHVTVLTMTANGHLALPRCTNFADHSDRIRPQALVVWPFNTPKISQ